MDTVLPQGFLNGSLSIEEFQRRSEIELLIRLKLDVTSNEHLIRFWTHLNTFDWFKDFNTEYYHYRVRTGSSDTWKIFIECLSVYCVRHSIELTLNF